MIGIQRAHPLSCGGKWEQPLGLLDLCGVLADSSWWQISVAHKEEHCARTVRDGTAALGGGAPEAGRACRATCQVLPELEETRYVPPGPAGLETWLVPSAPHLLPSHPRELRF